MRAEANMLDKKAADHLNKMIRLRSECANLSMDQVILNQNKIVGIQAKFLAEKAKKIQEVTNRQKYILKKEMLRQNDRYGEA